MQINVFDFDETIYNGDSTVDFYKFCIRKNPKLLRFIPSLIGAAFKYAFNRDLTALKQKFYLFLTGIEDIDKEIDLFWKDHESNIKKWYAEKRSDGDVVISASPEFLLSPICDKLGIKMLIASRVDKKTGVYIGKNCKGREKVNRLYEQVPDAEIIDFYSDSHTDDPLAVLAKNAYFVTKDTYAEWEF